MVNRVEDPEQVAKIIHLHQRRFLDYLAMGTFGGKRPGAGRPKGSKAPHTIQTSALRGYIIARFMKERKPIIDALMDKGRKGDVQALKEILDRVLGKSIQPIEVNKAQKLIVLDVGDED